MLQFEKKPYNPILGETHLVWTESEEFGRTECLSEQVIHHPPGTVLVEFVHAD